MVQEKSAESHTLDQQVVVAEDDCITRRVIVAWLEDAGFRVTSVDNGRQALAEVTRNRASVLVTDWNMPEMDGYELCQRLRASEYRPYPYIIMVTSRESPTDIEAAIDAGADDYLVKPVRHGDLVARIKQAQSVLQRIRDYVERVETDELTGLQNRRRFEECFAVEFEQAVRNDRSLSCVVMDLDCFKYINDRWGHGVGDKALQHVARIVLRKTSKSGYACRYGGDEFCLLLPRAGEEEACFAAEEIRASIETMPLEAGEGRSITMSATFGVAAARGGGTTPRELIDAADEALLAAKQSGRNCVLGHGQLSDLRNLNLFAPDKHQARLSSMTAREIMTTPIVTLHEASALREAGDLFLRLRVASVPVVNSDSKLVGVVSENDVLAAVATAHNWEAAIATVMQRNVLSYEQSTQLSSIWEALSRIPVRRVVIVDGEVPVGVISRGTLLRWMGNWGGTFYSLRDAGNGRIGRLGEQIRQVTPAIVQELQELQSHAVAGSDSVVAETVNTVTRIQEQVQELLAFCQVNHCFQPVETNQPVV